MGRMIYGIYDDFYMPSNADGQISLDYLVK